MSINGVTPIDSERLLKCKKSYVTRRVPIERACGLRHEDVRPAAGDLLLARVDHLGQHTRLESPEGRRQHLHVGDEIILCYGNRYATEQFEAIVPKSLEPCHLVAAGGIAATALTRHSSKKSATRITPLGLLVDGGGCVLNVRDYALDIPLPRVPQPMTIAVMGAAMDAGKTTVVSNLIRGLRRQQLRVGVAKVTGTGSGPDPWRFYDAGADVVVDFTDAGLASTYQEPPARIEKTGLVLINHLAHQQVDVILLEFADGLLQQEARAVLESATFRKHIDGVIYAASDSLNAFYGIERLQQANWPLMGVSGRITAAPLQCAEVASHAELPILYERDLTAGDIYQRLQFWVSQCEKSVLKGIGCDGTAQGMAGSSSDTD